MSRARYDPIPCRRANLAQVVTVDLELTPLDGESRSLSEWLTTFPLVPVVIDPYTHESAWLLDTARRILASFAGADCRPCWLITCGADDARQFLGPFADEFLTFLDPDASFARALGLSAAPAIALVRQDGAVTASAEGWSPEGWREVVEAITAHTQWTRPQIPADGDPAAFAGTELGS